MLSTDELLRKAVLDTSDFGGTGGTNAGGAADEAPLSVEQVSSFIELMQADQVMLRNVRTVMSSAASWQESIVDFADRIAKPGTQATRLSASDRSAPSTGQVEIQTVLLRAEVPVSDEVFEDNVAREGFRGSLERTIADRFGYDIEDLLVNGDVSHATDTYLQQLDGWFKLAQANGNDLDGSSYGQDYDEIFRVLLNTQPNRFLRNLSTQGAYFVPTRVEQKLRDIRAARGTALGDRLLQEGDSLRYQGIEIIGVPSIEIQSDGDTKIMLAHKQNLYAGYQRAMRFETFRDPREGAVSFVVTARVDAEVAVPNAVSIAYDVDATI